jgi:transposase
VWRRRCGDDRRPGYDHDKYRRLVWKRGVKPVIARRQTEHGTGLGRHRWVVEPTFACSTTAAGSSSAPTAATTSTKASSPSPAASSAGDGSKPR